MEKYLPGKNETWLFVWQLSPTSDWCNTKKKKDDIRTIFWNSFADSLSKHNTCNWDRFWQHKFIVYFWHWLSSSWQWNSISRNSSYNTDSDRQTDFEPRWKSKICLKSSPETGTRGTNNFARNPFSRRFEGTKVSMLSLWNSLRYPSRIWAVNQHWKICYKYNQSLWIYVNWFQNDEIQSKFG